jgi:hypothetical protein
MRPRVRDFPFDGPPLRHLFLQGHSTHSNARRHCGLYLHPTWKLCAALEERTSERLNSRSGSRRIGGPKIPKLRKSRYFQNFLQLVAGLNSDGRGNLQ